MTADGEDPTIEEVLLAAEEYQAPPREENETEAADEALERLEDQASEEPADIDFLEPPQKPDISASTPVAPSGKNFTVSGPDEETQPGGPHVPPPGESM